jgi:hypothetical protein
MRLKLVTISVIALVGVTSAMFNLAVAADSLSDSNAVKQSKYILTLKEKYPPYPDVWDWQDRSTENLSGKIYLLKNGDALFEYIKKSRKSGKISSYAITFFGREIVDGDSAIEKAREHEVETDKQRKKLVRFAVLKPESQDKKWKIREVFSYDLKCYAGANRYPHALIDLTTGKERIFTIFRLLDKPEGFDVADNCLYGPGSSIKYKVKSVSGYFIFLLDNTFLFHVHDTGEVIRFDTDLKTKSKLIGDRFFLLENQGSPMIMDDYSDKDYEFLDRQEETDDLYKYLMNLRKNKGK